MAEEMMLENVPWESDEAEDSESDEAMAEAEDSAEFVGIGGALAAQELARRRQRQSRYRPTRGVHGMRLRGQDGRPRTLQFPAKLATAAETNRGLANQEVGRRALEVRLDRLETRFRVQQKKDSSVSGAVSLFIGAPLAAWGVFNPKQTGGSRFGNWAAEESTKMATLTAVSQIASSGAKLLINGRYHRSGVGIAADIFAGAQIAAYAFASMYKPVAGTSELDMKTAWGNRDKYEEGTEIFVVDLGKTFLAVGKPPNRRFRPIG